MNGSSYIKNGDFIKHPNHADNYSKAAVATDNEACSAVATETLKRGGSAVDAAIAGMLCVGIQNAHSAGLGGGLVMSIYDAETGESVYLNSLSTSSKHARHGVFGNEEETFYRVVKGATAISMPGDVSAFWAAHQKYGRLPWKQLFDPAIHMALNGIRIQKALALAIECRQQHVLDSPSLRELFVNPDGTIKKEGDMLKMPKLAATLRKVAVKGRKTFYEGEVAEMILDDIKGHPSGDSLITEDDLKSYKTEIAPLLEINVGDLTFLAPNLPSGGPLFAHIINILKGFNFGPHSIQDTNSSILTYHRILEAFKAAYLQRIDLGDPWKDASIYKDVKKLITDEFSEQQRKRIDDSKASNARHYGVDLSTLFPPDDAGTSHISVLDERGNAVSLTSTINYYFGCKIVGRRSGIIFNNGMKNFSVCLPHSTEDAPAKGTFPIPLAKNLMEPNKRPLSSMCPMIVLDKNQPLDSRVQMVIGASGGVRIPTAIAWVIIHHVWFKKDIGEAVLAGRMHYRVGRRLETQIEENVDDEIVERLILQKGHSVSDTPYGKPGTVVQAISKLRTAGIAAASDPRKYGVPKGY